MSQPPHEAAVQNAAPVAPIQPSGAFKNPTYPRRIHIQERAHWQGVLQACQERVNVARSRLEGIAGTPDRARFERLFAQMLGARDQVAEASRRLPGEVGDLYHEDRERLEQAVAALDRVFRKWDAL